jgi:hypothetical protein
MVSQSCSDLADIQLLLNLGSHVYEQLAEFLCHHPNVGVDWLGEDFDRRR